MSEYQDLIAKNYQDQQVSADSRMFGLKEVAGRYFVSADWLHNHLNKVKIIEVLNDTDEKFSCRPLDEYLNQHIPGALGMYRHELGPVKDYFLKDEELFELLRSYGISVTDTVVFYSSYSRYGLYSASRAAFAAYYLGVTDVKILDGGWQAWEAGGFPVEEGNVLAQSIPDFGVSQPKRPEALLSTPQDVKDFMASRDKSVLVSIRSYNEYIGDNQGSSWNRGKGEIAGALFGGDDKLLNELGFTANPKEYLADWQSRGISPDKDVILYCGTSWRASTAFFILKELGWPSVYLFDGSWHKWHAAHDTDPKNFPIQIGLPGSKAYQIIDDK